MTDDQQSELEQIRSVQSALGAQWTQIEQRLRALEADARTRAPLPPPPAEIVPPAPALPFPIGAEKTPPTPPETPPLPEPAPESLEIRIGSVWLVRAGIVLLLTSLAFAANYLYEHIIPHLGPGAKVGLLYAAAGALGGFGAWLERSREARGNIRLQNYARVIFAGGLAAVYYVTYAAHYFPPLRIIPGACTEGVLLLVWTGFMAWLADRRDSETLATFAILLAYYTSAINGIAGFTLWSNLALSVGAVYLLSRHLWRIFPFASLLATYGSYAFWRYYHAFPAGFAAAGALRISTPLWVECVFLSLYWVLFTGAILAARGRVLPVSSRADFASVNNSVFFALMVWVRWGEYPFWRLAGSFGAVLLAVSELAPRFLGPLDLPTRGVYRGMGILSVTLAMMDYFSGWHLSLLLAAETVLLVLGAVRGRSVLVLVSAMATALVAALTVVPTLVAAAEGYEASPWPAAASCGGLLLFAAWWCQQSRERAALPGSESSVGRQDEGTAWASVLRRAPGCFSLLGVGIWFFLLENRIPSEVALSPALAAAAVVLLALAFVLRIRMIAWAAHAYVILAQVPWLVARNREEPALAPLWSIVALLAATVAWGCGWKWLERQRQSSKGVSATDRQPVYILILALGVCCGWQYVNIVNPALHVGAFTLAARWSVYAAGVFALGLMVRERVYRWLGLIILCFTLLRVVVFDLWQLDLLERAFSFLSLGVVLLALGFLYNRFSAKFRDIL